MSLSKQSVVKLKQVKAAILAQPKFYSQNKWVSSVDSCGSTCCIAGWADFVVNGKKAHNARVKGLKAPIGQEWKVADEWMDITAEALEITSIQAERLTESSVEWPGDLKEEYFLATSPKQRALVAGKWIDYFIAMDGEA